MKRRDGWFVEPIVLFVADAETEAAVTIRPLRQQPAAENFIVRRFPKHLEDAPPIKLLPIGPHSCAMRKPVILC